MDYYYKTMDYFYLESISRFEFAYQLANRLEKDGVTDINIDRFLTMQFRVDVSCPCVKEIAGTDYLFF